MANESGVIMTENSSNNISDEILEDRSSGTADTTASPDEWCWCLRLINFHVFPLVIKGWSETIDLQDAPKLAKSMESIEVSNRLRQEWEAQKKLPDGRLWKAIVYALYAPLLFGSTMSAMAGLCATVGRPLVLQAFIREAARQDGDPWDAVWVLPLFGMVVLGEGLMSVMYRQSLCEEAGWQFNAGVTNLLMEKTLTARSRNASKKENRLECTALVGNDVIRIIENSKAAASLPLAMSGLTGGVCILFLTIGPSFNDEEVFFYYRFSILGFG